MFLRAVIAVSGPLLLQALWWLINIVYLVDCHALVGQVKNLVVEVGIDIALRSHNLLDTGISPTWPVMPRKHHLSLLAEKIERLVDLFRPHKRISDQGAAKCVNIVNCPSDILRCPKSLELRQPCVHFRRRLSTRRILEYHFHTVDG